MIETTIEPALSTAAETVAPDLPASEAAQHLRDPAVPALVVVDETDDVIGIVTESDFVALVAESVEPRTVEELMSTPVVTIPSETTMGLAADRMTEAGVKHLPVVDDGTYRGLVSLESVAPYLSRSRLRVVWNGDPIRVDPDDRSGAESADSGSSSERPADS